MMKLEGRKALIILMAALVTGCANPLFRIGPFLERLEVTQPPAKTEYGLQEALDLAGLEVTGFYDDGSDKRESIELSQVTGYNPLRLGSQTLTVTVQDKAATFPVTVSEYWVINHGLTVETGAALEIGIISTALPEDFSGAVWKVRLSGGPKEQKDPYPGESAEDGRLYAFTAPAEPGYYTVDASVSAGGRSYRRTYQFTVMGGTL
jgi:hypothetical protein